MTDATNPSMRDVVRRAIERHVSSRTVEIRPGKHVQGLGLIGVEAATNEIMSTVATNPSAKTGEPVAYCNTEHLGRIKRESAFGGEASSTIYGYPCGAYRTPLYTHPQPSLSVGLDREAVARRIYENRPASIIHPENRVITWGEAAELVPDRVAQVYCDADAILALAAPAEGYVLVPVEPTEAMLDAMFAGYVKSDGSYREAYRAMIAAYLPAAPTGGRS